MKKSMKVTLLVTLTILATTSACNYTLGVNEDSPEKNFEELNVDPSFNYTLNELHQISEVGKFVNLYSYVGEEVNFLGTVVGGNNSRVQMESSIDGYYYDVLPNALPNFKSGVDSFQNKKLIICHIPPGNPENAHTIEIASAAWPAHRDNHGDSEGPCENDSFEDSDGDGVVDHIDDFPYDSLFAFTSYYPGNDELATLLFEDMWPNKGDYDFNDFVLNYNLKYKKNADNKIVGIDYTYKVAAIGGIKTSSFYVRLLDKNRVALPYQVVEEVSGNNLEQGFAKVRNNGTEIGSDEAIIPVIDNTRNAFEGVTSTQKINVVVGEPSFESETTTISILFNKPYDEHEVYFDPFIIVDYNRELEIHLPVFGPTELAKNSNYFGTGDDNTDMKNNNFYKSENHFPWGLNVPREIAYPKENADFSITYNEFSDWAESRGVKGKQWYFQQEGKFKPEKVFKRKIN